MTPSNDPRQPGPRTFPRSGESREAGKSGKSNPNLATLDRLRGLRRPRLMQPEARRHQLPQECRAC